ncbi:MAG: 5-formyltetrahydrofolate cyclo-ligase [Ruminococcus sp.]|nr:5-formyltetrahydrofolate cyclo-ligase [Ruminococcus sp.]
MVEKRELRAHYKKLRREMSPSERKQADRLITEAFLNSDEYRSCEMLLCFVSTGIEVSTREILTRAFAEKTVLCPKCIGSPSEGIMRFYEAGSFSELEEGTMGILEPSEKCREVTEFENALCVLPGLCFDRRGYRLGFGGGYYDRFLAGFNGVKAGICYESCVCDELAHNEYDMKADMLFTDKCIYRY